MYAVGENVKSLFFFFTKCSIPHLLVPKIDAADFTFTSWTESLEKLFYLSHKLTENI